MKFFINKGIWQEYFQLGLSERREKMIKHLRKTLEMTITGEIPFNENHPFYRDEAFFNDLLSYYKKKEDYETCNNLLNKKKKKS